MTDQARQAVPRQSVLSITFPRRLACLGAGHVGGPTMAVLADMWQTPSNDRSLDTVEALVSVTVADPQHHRVCAWQRGTPPVAEPGLVDILQRTLRHRDASCTDRRQSQSGCVSCGGCGVLDFTVDVASAVRDAELVFIAVGTPSSATGGYDLSAYDKAARVIAHHAMNPLLVVEKSTVPIRTAERLRRILREEWSARHDGSLEAVPDAADMFEVVSNPEFLSEGTAVSDLTHPDRVLIGHAETPAGCHAAHLLSKLYSRWVAPERILKTDLWSAEMGKLASNAMLAQRLSSINALSALCEAAGGDIVAIAAILGSDTRIGSKYLRAGVGFGGSCLGKDLRGLVYLFEQFDLRDEADYWRAVLFVNDAQKGRFARRVLTAVKARPDEEAVIVAVLGLAFKPDTADLRDSPALDVCRALLQGSGRAILRVYDPLVCREDIEALLGDAARGRIEIAPSLAGAVAGSSIIVLLTECPEFTHTDLDWESLRQSMSGDRESALPVFDGRNCLPLDRLQAAGFRVHRIGISINTACKL